jgi:chromosome partitioning protein
MAMKESLFRKKAGKSGRARRRAIKQLFLNYKGGTGKTSISAAYGYYLAKQGKKVLMVDLDPQAHLTTCLNQEGVQHDKSLYSVIVRRERLSKIIVRTSLPKLKLVPSAISLSALELSLARMISGEFRLKKALRSAEKEYDFIIMDAAPSIGILSLNAILASDAILIPALADFLSFHGLKILLETLSSIEKDFRFYLEEIHIFLNRYNSDYEICKESKAAINRFYPEYSLKTIIRESEDFITASSVGKSIFEINAKSTASQDIKSLVEEVNGE